MVAPLLALVSTLAVAAADGERLAGAMPLAPLQELATAALPAPPATVERVTRRYGTVTIDHQHHLEVRASCKGCHGPGRIGPIEFTSQVAHERCIGCHKERERGPTSCALCHVRTAPAAALAAPGQPAAATTQAAPAAAVSVAAEGSASPDAAVPAATPASASVAAAGAMAPSAPAAGKAVAPGPRGSLEPAPPGAIPVLAAATGSPSRSGGRDEPRPSSRAAGLTRTGPALELGLDLGASLGGTLRFSSRGDRLLTSFSAGRMGGDAAYLLSLLGVGTWLPLSTGLAATGEVLGGVDGTERPSLGYLPVLGMRAGLEWAPRRGWLARSLGISISALSTVGQGSTYGHHAPATRVFATLGLGLPMPGR